MDFANLIQTVAIYALPVLFAITVHEAAHGYVARHYGDGTAAFLGRVTLNPLKHIDPIGTIVVPAVMFFTTGFMFGWAKPVPVVTRNLRDTRIGMRMVAIAGPASNFAMMFGWAVLMVLVPLVPQSFQYPMQQMAYFGVMINAVLFVLNMIPILPLDGGRFVDTFLSAKASFQFRKIEPYGMWILIALLFTGLLSKIMQPFLALVLGIVQGFMRLFGG